jgi:hypothetical protein
LSAFTHGTLFLPNLEIGATKYHPFWVIVDTGTVVPVFSGYDRILLPVYKHAPFTRFFRYACLVDLQSDFISSRGAADA